MLGPAGKQGRVRGPGPGTLGRLALAGASALCALAFARGAAAFAPQRPYPPADVRPPVTPLWATMQLVPSPEWLFASEGVHFGLRWQVTPLLYSFGARRGLSRTRMLVVEPLLRQGGSIELFVSPEYLFVGADLHDRLGARVGVRSYFPLQQRGDYLSCSIGTSYLRLAGEGSAAIEAGAYAFGGFLGAQVAYSRELLGGSVLTTLSVRFF